MGFDGDTSTLGSAVDQTITRAIAIAALAGIAVIHVLQLPDAFSEAGYLGALFVAAVVASVALAMLIARTGDPRAVEAAGALAGLILLGYLISRTVGLPAATDDVGEWTEPLGLVSMVAEGLLAGLAASVAATSRAPGTARGRAGSRWSRMPRATAG